MGRKARAIFNFSEVVCRKNQPNASADCPLCAGFIHVKTLLYESLDACQSLDEVDCDAWTEFHKPCKNNLIEKFGSVDFSNNEACKY